MPLLRSVILRAALAGLLLLAYFGAWRPGRTAVTTGAVAPALEAAAGEDSPYAVERRGYRVSVTSGNDSFRFVAPGGVKFLLPALALIVLLPYRPYWLVILGGHVGLSVLSVGVLCLGLAGQGWGFAVHGFIRAYLVDAVSLGVAAVAIGGEVRPRE
jgi:hypothetical protein